MKQIKEWILVGPQKRSLMDDEKFGELFIPLEKRVWQA
jgi:hypothetical protein